MKTSTDRILTTHVGSLPRPESIKALLRARLSGQPVEGLSPRRGSQRP
jgi:methionine synthase II (cobalamin-independent)